MSIEAALRRSVQDAREPTFPGPDGKPRTTHVAIGDAQAPLATFLGILDLHGLVGENGRLKDHVHLISIGDHFDYGPPAWRDWATREGLQLLSWLAAHPPDQVTLILGNHDHSRVGELATFDQPTYERARAEADRVYRAGNRDEAAEPAFHEAWPQVHDSEILARDYSTFSTRQRGLVTHLLREKRFRLAHEHNGLLFNHAGVTKSDLAPLGLTGSIADALNRFLDDAVSRWKSGPLSLAPLYRFDDGDEPRGILGHRPAHPSIAKPDQLAGPPRRRFDPRDLPTGVTQVIGHIRDGKCRDLLGEWTDGQPAIDGPLRRLTVTADTVRYERGCSRDAALLFIDGGMNYAPIERYELLDCDAVQPRAR